MKKSFVFKGIALSGVLFALISLTGCSVASPDPDEEAVWVEKPWFFGHGGIDQTAVSTGLSYGCISSDAVYFKIVPTRYDEKFEDIFSNDNTALDFHSYINIQIERGKSPILLANYGEDWYKNNIQVEYRNKTREYVSMFSPFDLISNREILAKIDSMLMADMVKYVAELSAEKEFPIIIRSITTGAARPNKGQLAEMDRTAKAIQAAKTEERLCEAENKRADTEEARAIADKKYKDELGLTNDQFLTLQLIETLSKIKDANINVVIGPGVTPMVNVSK